MNSPLKLTFEVVACAVMLWLAGRSLLATPSLVRSYPVEAKATVAETVRHALGAGTSAIDTQKVTVATKDGARLTFHCDTGIKLAPGAEVDVLLSADGGAATTSDCQTSKPIWLNLVVGVVALLIFLRLLAGLQGAAALRR